MKKIIQTLRCKWTEYLFDMMVIIIGIIVALILNSWHDQSVNKKQEHLILTGLFEEFEANITAIERDIYLNKKTLSSIDEIIYIIRGERLEDESDYLDQLILHTSMFSSFDAQTGFTDEIIQSGKLNLIRDQVLKVQITKWTSILENGKEDTQLTYAYYNSVLVPYLTKYIPISNGDQYIDFSKWSEGYEFPKLSKSQFKADFDIMNMMEFESIMWQHKYNQNFIVLNSLEIESFLRNTLSMIEDNL